MMTKLNSVCWILLCVLGNVSNRVAAAPAAQVVPSIWVEGAAPGTLTLNGVYQAGSISISAVVISRTGVSVPVWQTTVNGSSSLSLPATPFSTAGFYKLSLTSSTAGSVPVELDVSVTAAPSVRTAGVPYFGINTHFAQRTISDDAYRLLKLANVDAIRDQWVWPSVEPSKGLLQSPSSPNGGPSHQASMLANNGLQILHNCAYGNPVYDNGNFPSSTAAVAAFAKYCGFVAAQFGSTLYGSEIWNESNTIDAATQYAPLAKATALVLQQVAPAAEILQGGGAGVGGGADPVYEETVYKTIGAGCCTGDSVHPYMTNPDVGYFAPGSRLSDPVSGQSIVNMDFVTFWLDYVDHEFGKSHSSHITELGWYAVVDGKDGVNLEKQAAYISRALIHATKPSACTSAPGSLASGLAKTCASSTSATIPDLKSVFIYDFQDDGTDPANSEHNFGLVNFDLTPKMAYSAYAQAAGVLRGAAFYKQYTFGAHSVANAYLYKTSDTDGWLVMWTTEFAPTGIVTAASQFSYSKLGRTQSTVAVKGSTPTSNLRCREWDGRPCVASTTLQISNLPVFMQVHGNLDSIGLVEVVRPLPVTDVQVH